MPHKQVGDWRLRALSYPPPYCMGRSNMPNPIDIVIIKTSGLFKVPERGTKLGPRQGGLNLQFVTSLLTM